ncbi:MAG: S24/S26 family peptidase [Bacteroidales bacterium]|nr:S24/S26 family peptidase [Bacteroidales bacterium]
MNYPELVRKILADGKVRYYETLSSGVSMFPTIWPNSELRAEYVPLDKIKRGDIIIFQRGERLVAHRVVVVGSDYVYTQGDSCLSKDEVVNAQNYMCRIAEYVMWKRYTITEKSLFWKLQCWGYLNIPGIHTANHYLVVFIVRILMLIGIVRSKK